jgi:predicted transcriptional regulator
MKFSDRINTNQLEFAANCLSVLIHPARSALIKLLMDNEGMNVTQLHNKLNLKLPETSNYLQIMYRYGILNSNRKGKSMIYSVNIEKLEKIISISEELSKW